jgi:preprotein translocase subunit YajC
LSNALIFVWLAVLAAAFWFFVLRPQRTARARQRDLHNELDMGDEVVTIGGLHGTIVGVDDDTIDIEPCEGVRLTFSRRAIAGLANPQGQADEDSYDDEELEDEHELEDDAGEDADHDAEGEEVAAEAGDDETGAPAR